LTNDFSLEPGELAFIYHRRWDEEKFFDNFKNDLAGAKSLGKNPNSH
jgi:IS4 transposase